MASVMVSVVRFNVADWFDRLSAYAWATCKPSATIRVSSAHGRSGIAVPAGKVNYPEEAVQ